MFAEVVILIIGMFASFFAMAICTFAKPTEKTKYCFMAALGAFIYFLACFLQIFCEKLSLFIMLQKIALTSGLYMLLGSAYAISCMFNVTFSNRFKMISTLVSFLLVIIFLTFRESSPWAKEILTQVNETFDITYFKIKGDWFYYLLNSIVLILFIIWIIIILIRTASQKGREFKVFRYMLGFAMVPLFIWIITSLSLLSSSICNEFFFMLLLVVIIYVALFFSFVEDSRPTNDLLFNNSKKGIIVLDYKKRFLYANKSAELTFDIIAKGNKDAITAFINVNLIGEDNFFDGFNNYKLIMETISDETNPRAGYAIWIEKMEKINNLEINNAQE